MRQEVFKEEALNKI